MRGIPDLLDDHTLFWAWLLTHHPEQVVGTRWSRAENPLARYLREQGWREALVTPDEVWPAPLWIRRPGVQLCRPRTRLPLPPWAREYNRSIADGDEREIRAAEALAALEGATDDPGEDCRRVDAP